MNYWLLKTEPSTYSWSDLVRDKKTEWTGVRSYEARNNMRAMQKGDQIFVYHSGDEKAIVGMAEVVALAHNDPTDDTGDWQCVTIGVVKSLKKSVTLTETKTIPACKNMILLKKSRLSVQPVTNDEWNAIIKASI